MELLKLTLLVLCLLSVSADEDSPASRIILETFKGLTHSETFTHLAEDPVSKSLYFGATNAIYQLDSRSLTEKSRVRTGPELDSPMCQWDAKTCMTLELYEPDLQDPSNQGSASKTDPANEKKSPLSLMNNVNKILLAYPEKGVLIFCGSLHQGMCSVRRMENISREISRENGKAPEMVAANSANASTVAFLAPATSGSRDPKAKVLYVAASKSTEYYRDEFPTIASRLLEPNSMRFREVLPQNFELTGRSGLKIVGNFAVKYIDGFYFNGFSYIAMVQPESYGELEAPFVSKLGRVCTDDKKFESYAEITLECLGSDNTKYNILQALHVGKLGSDVMPDNLINVDDPDSAEFLIGVFAKGTKPEKIEHKNSAVCIFPLEKIRSSFWFNIERCRSGLGHLNLPQFQANTKCHNRSNVNVPRTDCFNAVGRVGGYMSLSVAAAFIAEDTVLTGVTVDVTRSHTILFMGTNDGRIVKGMLNSLTTGRIISEFQLSPTRAPVAAQLLIPTNSTHLLAMAGSQIFKLGLSVCEEHRTCATCLQSGDPYCGWCTLENKCSSVERCPQKDLAAGWLPWTGEKPSTCPHLLSPLDPSNASISIEAKNTVTVHLSSLPPPGKDGVYQCVFGESNYELAEFIPPATLRCNFPNPKSRPMIQEPGKDHLTVPLQLWSSHSHKIFHEEPFTFYDCGAHNLCTSCVSSQWSCHWCLLENRCVRDGSLCHNKVHVISAHARLQSESASHFTAVNGDSKCPHIDKAQMKGREILLPNGHSKTIRLPVSNLNSILGQQNSPISLEALECVVQVEGRSLRTKGRLESDGWVNCDPRVYHYDKHSPQIQADLYLSGGGSLVIDKIPVELYKCSQLSSDCSQCLTMDARYMCTWCAGGCHFREQCPLGTLPKDETARSVCPAPEIYNVSPLVGPLQGGTEITIIGKDLGTSMEDVNQRILIANTVPCLVKEYVVSKKIVCETMSVRTAISGPVSISLGRNKKGVSRQEFQFLSPSIHSIYPSFGPQSGGTHIIIGGSNLNAGSNINVWLGGAGSLRCELIAATDDTITCKTPPAPRSTWSVDEIRVLIDRANLTLRNSFKYVPDPRVISLEPQVSFKSGGRKLLVRGQSLNSILKPKIFLIDPIKLRKKKTIEIQIGDKEEMDTSDEHGDHEIEQLPPLASKLASCVAENATVMWCRSPMLLLNHHLRNKRSEDRSSQPEENVDLSTYPKWPIGFQMDGVEDVQVMKDIEITVVPDPEYYPFSGGYKIYRGDREPLILEGRYLSFGSSAEDVEVLIGTERCNLTLLAPNQLVCQPPQSQPVASDALGNAVAGNRPIVTVRVGSNLTFVLGEVAYAGAAGFKSSLSQAVMDPAVVGGIVTAAALFLLVIVVCIAVWWRRKSWQAEKEYKRIQLQMDNLESNVRMECKQAFAELQTDMSDLTSDLLALGIPFHTRRAFSAKVLFKDEQHQNLLLDWQHSITNGNGYSTHLHMALAQFESLLWDKQFVVLLVDTFERQSNFSAQDRVYVASLLTSALARNMQYCTDVILDLLKELINKNLESRYPQLMLRRTESVVEKMLSNWIALCLYDYLQEEPGASLFLMFRALKHQVEKGPVDAVTGEARYSLSEDRLLKEQINSEAMNLHVIPCVESESNETVICRVLDVDTISQVKSKVLDTLYRNNPHSTRPSIADFDLEWRCSPRGHVVLMDDERGSPSSKDGWKRLNTLQSFNVPNNAVVALIPRCRGSYTYSSTSSHYASINSSTLLIPNGHHSPESVDQTARYWHLVRPQSMYLNGDSPHLTLSRGSNRTLRSLDSTNTLPKSIPEIYLTRLLTSKGTVQKFVDDFFSSALFVSQHTFPIVIKYLFDFFEKEAMEHQVEDPGVVYSWKNNSLPLRFWVNIIKNPDFVFDIDKSSTVDSCLSVVAQTFMDACSPNEPRLGKDSPSNKLLFAKDIPRYREQVSQFYHDIRQLPPVSTQELNTYMATLSKSYAQEFNVLSAVRELLCYVVKYSDPLLEALDADPTAQRRRLADRLDQVLGAMSGRTTTTRCPPPDIDDTEHIYAAVR